MTGNGTVGLSGMGARGLTHAILDTFPVVKFGRHAADADTSGGTPQRVTKDIELPTRENLEMTSWKVMENPSTGNRSRLSSAVTSLPGSPSDLPMVAQYRPASGESPRPSDQTSTQLPPSDGPIEEVAQDAMGRETCPICIVDFEEGDDLRVLPCEGNHQFHQTCVDPWLLELSSSCPICRQGKAFSRPRRPLIFVNSFP
jgi:hypothetical protein